MGEGVGHHVAPGRLLQTVVAHRLRGIDYLLDIPFLEHVVTLLRMVRPGARQKVGLQFQPHPHLVALRLGQAAPVDEIRQAEQMLNMVNDLVRDDIGRGKIPVHAELPLHLFEKRKIQINRLVSRQVKRPEAPWAIPPGTCVTPE